MCNLTSKKHRTGDPICRGAYGFNFHLFVKYVAYTLSVHNVSGK